MGPPLDDALLALEEAAAGTLNRRGRYTHNVISSSSHQQLLFTNPGCM